MSVPLFRPLIDRCCGHRVSVLQSKCCVEFSPLCCWPSSARCSSHRFLLWEGEVMRACPHAAVAMENTIA